MTWTVYNINGGGWLFLFIFFFKESHFDPFFPRNPWMETQLCDFHESIDFIFGKEVKMIHIYQCIIHTVKNIF